MHVSGALSTKICFVNSTCKPVFKLFFLNGGVVNEIGPDAHPVAADADHVMHLSNVVSFVTATSICDGIAKLFGDKQKFSCSATLGCVRS